MPEKKAASASDEKPKAKRSSAKRVSAAKKAAASGAGAPPAKRAEHLSKVYPELADPVWVQGNQEAARKLRGE